MKHFRLFNAVLFSLAVTAAHAQNDSTQFIFGLPVTEDDTVPQALVRDVEPKDRLTPIEPSELPEKLRSALNDEEQYRGWQDSTVYLERNTGLYLVPIKYEEGIKLFGLNENGRAVTYNEITIVVPPR